MLHSKNRFLKPAVEVQKLLGAGILTHSASAGEAFPAPPGGWVYLYDGDQAQPTPCRSGLVGAVFNRDSLFKKKPRILPGAGLARRLRRQAKRPHAPRHRSTVRRGARVAWLISVFKCERAMMIQKSPLNVNALPKPRRHAGGASNVAFQRSIRTVGSSRRRTPPSMSPVPPTGILISN